jgi:DNA repair protein RadC
MASPSYSRIKDWPEDERPRERWLRWGEGELKDAQLLALLLRTGEHASGASAVDVARHLLYLFEGDLEAISAATVKD